MYSLMIEPLWERRAARMVDVQDGSRLCENAKNRKVARTIFLRQTEIGLARECLRNYRRFSPTFLLSLSSAFEFLHSLGHLRHFERRSETSALTPIPDVMLSRSKRRSGPILL